MLTNEESTRDESQSSLLGEESPPLNEVAMEQKTNSTGEVNTREESQDSMAEIRQILAIVVNECNSDIDMSQQETSEREVTITDIIEEINKSSSSKSNNSTQEELENKLVINEDTLEQSTRDEFQSSLLGEALTNQHPTVTTQETITPVPIPARNNESDEVLIPREKYSMVNLNVIDLLRKLQIDETSNNKSEVSQAGPNKCLVQVITPLQLKKI